MFLRLRLEALDERVLPSWGSVPPSIIPIPGGAASIGLNNLGDAQGDAAIAANEIDYYTFIAPKSGSYKFSALTPAGSMDTVLGVYSSRGKRIAFNDDISPSNYDSQVTVNLTAGQRFYVGITNYVKTPGGDYTWAVDGPASIADDIYENNDVFLIAKNLGTLTAPKVVSNLVMIDSADWFRFTTSAAGSTGAVSIAFQHALGDLDLQLYSSTGTLLASSTGGSDGETISLAGFAAGTYSVRVFGYDGAANPSYSLTVTPPSPTPVSGYDIVVVTSGLTASQHQLFQQAAARWEQIIVGDLPNANYFGVLVDDILIHASATHIDGLGGELGHAGPDAFRPITMLPYHGTMEFDSADIAYLEATGQLYSVILHEMGHVLGFGTIWQMLGLLGGAGTSNPRFLGALATAEYNAIFDLNQSSVPVEGNSSDDGSADTHWRESVFGNDLMTPYIAGSSNPIGRVTVASLADLGYTVNMDAADVLFPPI